MPAREYQTVVSDGNTKCSIKEKNFLHIFLLVHATGSSRSFIFFLEFKVLSWQREILCDGQIVASVAQYLFYTNRQQNSFQIWWSRVGDQKWESLKNLPFYEAPFHDCLVFRPPWGFQRSLRIKARIWIGLGNCPGRQFTDKSYYLLYMKLNQHIAIHLNQFPQTYIHTYVHS